MDPSEAGGKPELNGVLNPRKESVSKVGPHQLNLTLLVHQIRQEVNIEDTGDPDL